MATNYGQIIANAVQQGRQQQSTSSAQDLVNDFNQLAQDPRFVARIWAEGVDFSLTGIMKKLPDIAGGQEFTGLLDAVKEQWDKATDNAVGNLISGLWNNTVGAVAGPAAATAKIIGMAANGSVVDSPWSSVKAFSGNKGFEIRLELVCLLNNSSNSQMAKNPYELAAQAFRMVTSPDTPAFGDGIMSVVRMAAQSTTCVQSPLMYRPFPSRGLIALQLGKVINTTPLFLCSEVSIKNASLLDAEGYPVLVEYEFTFEPYRMVYYQDIAGWFN